VNVVVAVNALHWFAESKESFDEIHRVLVPGGMFGIIWYTPDYTCPWLAEITEYLEPLYRQNGIYFPPFSKNYGISKVNESAKFDQVEGSGNLFPTDLEYSYESALSFFCSLSVISVADEDTKSKFKQFFDDIIVKYFSSKEDKLKYIRYVAGIYWCKKH